MNGASFVKMCFEMSTVMGAEMKCDVFNVIIELDYLSNKILSVLLFRVLSH